MGCPPGMRGCAATCGHRAFVDGYRQERQRWEAEREIVTSEWPEEMRDFQITNPSPMFKDWLIQSKREQPDMEMATINGRDREMPDGWNEWADQRANSFVQFKSIAEADEASLLSIGMNSDAAISALQVISTPEFSHPFHRNVHQAILGLANDQLSPLERDNRPTKAEREALGQTLPHDAEKVTDLLRERGQLPMTHDPHHPRVTIDQARYGLGVWQAHALPADSAGYFASQVRSRHRQHVTTQIGERLIARAAGSLEQESGFGPVTDLVGETILSAAQELVNLPPALDFDAKPVSKAQTSDSVAVWEPTAQEIITPRENIRSLYLPQPPQLSQTARMVLRGA